jgi:hypothetical protein
MTTHIITSETVSTILKHALAGKPVRHIAGVVDLPVEDVQDVLTSNGHPDEKAMRRALGRLPHQPAPVLSAVSGGAKPRPPATVTFLPAPGDAPTPDQVIVAAQKSTSPKVQRAVARAVKARQAFEDAITKLTDAMGEDREAAKVRAEIEALEKKLAAARAKLGLKHPAPGPKPGRASWGMPPGASVAQVRDWARQHDLPVSETGRIPKAIVDEYTAAHTTTARVAALHEAAWPTPRPGAEA